MLEIPDIIQVHRKNIVFDAPVSGYQLHKDLHMAEIFVPAVVLQLPQKHDDSIGEIGPVVDQPAILG